MIGLALLLFRNTPPSAALEVTIDEYPFVAAALSPNRRLAAADNDFALMDRTLRDAGFDPRPLRQKAATAVAIRQGLENLVESAKPGSDVVFYFSGAGGVAPDGEPTLVPADNLKNVAQADVPMSIVESMAERAHAKGAHVTVIIDACFVPGPQGRSEGRVYKHVPKCAPRPNSAALRADLFHGPGVFLCPTQGSGQTYEWKPTVEATSWTSVFTDYLTGVADEAILLRKMPSVPRLMADANAYFRTRAREGYLEGMNVALRPDSVNPDHRLPFLVAGELPVLPPGRRDLVARRVKRLQEREKTFTVALVLDDAVVGDARRLALTKRLNDVAQAIENDGVRVAGEYESRVDRVVSVDDAGGIALTVQGGNLTAAESARFAGRSPQEAVAAGLGTYLDGELSVKRLWNLIEANPGRLDLEARMVQSRVAPKAKVEIALDVPTAGYLYVLDRDDASGDVKLIFPNILEENPYVSAGRRHVPSAIENIPGKSPLGGAALVVLFFPSSTPSLPELPRLKARTEAQANRDFEGPRAAHLRELLRSLSTAGTPYGSKRLEYEIL